VPGKSHPPFPAQDRKLNQVQTGQRFEPVITDDFFSVAGRFAHKEINLVAAPRQGMTGLHDQNVMGAPQEKPLIVRIDDDQWILFLKN
jgi:hypothetical protein